MCGSAAPQHARGGSPDGPSAHELAVRRRNDPKARTLELVAAELALVRDQLDRHVAAGRLRLAGERCVELDQLVSELGRLRSHVGTLIAGRR